MRINEGLDYHDMKGQIDPRVSVDEYAARMGEDSEIVTVTFKLKSKLASKDLVSWLERGYDFVLDAKVSDGEITPGKWLVFVEMMRRSNVPEKILTILKDLETLTDMDLKEYKIAVDDKVYKPDVETLKDVILTSPRKYREVHEEEKEEEEESKKQKGNKKAAPEAPPEAAAPPAAPEAPPEAPPEAAAPPTAPAPAAGEELSEMRSIAGLDHKQKNIKMDDELRRYLNIAGL